jgi:uncharacterized protein YjeT (DUF2065 family)
VSPLLVWILLALALVAVLAGLRLFLLKPPDRPPDWRTAFRNDPRAALRDLLTDPLSAAGREAERSGGWAAARDAYARALDQLRSEASDDPGVALKRRALESKLEELDRRAASGSGGEPPPRG